MTKEIVYRFFDPHPGLAGCTEPLPELLVAYLRTFENGVVADPDEVREQIAARVPEDWEIRFSGNYVVLHGGDVVDVVGIKRRRFNWKLLNYEVE